MALVLETAAVVEPVTLGDVKNYLKIDHNAEDVLIASMITAARVQLETRLGRAFLRQLWSLYVDILPPTRMVNLPINPVISIVGLAVVDELGVYNDVAVSEFNFDLKADPTFLKIVGQLPPIASEYSGIRIQFWAGYGAAAGDTPAPIIQAIMMLVG